MTSKFAQFFAQRGKATFVTVKPPVTDPHFRFPKGLLQGHVEPQRSVESTRPNAVWMVEHGTAMYGTSMVRNFREP